MELAHPPSITITSSISSLSSEPRYPWPKLKPTTRSRRRCPAGIIRLAAAATCWPHPPLIGHNVWGAQRRNRISSSTRRNNGLLVVPSATDSSVAGPEPGVGEGDERPNPMPCVFKFMSFLYPFQGKKGISVLLPYFMGLLANSVEFVIHPTPLGGMNVGIALKVTGGWESDNIHVPLFGKPIGFTVSQTIQGRVMLRNADTFIDPIVRGMEPILSKCAALLRPIVERVSPIIEHKQTRAFIYCLLTGVIMSILIKILMRSLG